MPIELSWKQLVAAAYARRVNLSAQAHYATPRIHYDKGTEQGEPFAYHVFGSAVVEVTVDCLRGTYKIDRVRVVHDGGRSLDPLVDLGQLEGGLVQGIGWVTTMRYFLPIYPYLLILHLAFVCYWLIRLKKELLISVVVIL